MTRNFSLRLRLAAAVALVAAAPLASAQPSAPRYIDEPVWREFVYEKIGATPSIRIGWAKPVTVVVRDFDFDRGEGKPSPAAAKPAVAQASRDFDLTNTVSALTNANPSR